MIGYKTLNKEQQEAVTFGNGPLLIIAGAGTGKTTVITERIKHLILEKDISPSNILALTFTEKAANEMEERIDIAMPYGYTNMWIHTFHSFCDRVLRDQAHNIGLDPSYKLLSESESILFLKKNIFELGLDMFRPLGNPTKFIDALLTHFSRLKDEDITPDEYCTWAIEQKDEENKKQYLELSHAYKVYEELKVASSVMDFSDLISHTLFLLRKRKNILHSYRKQFRYIFVDEFQDTNYAQNELAMLLAGDEQNITVVADDDQSIYRFRGAAVSNVLQFKNNYPASKIITLTNNYRSSQTILDAAYQLIQHNNPNRLEVVERINKKLISNTTAPKKEIKFIHTLTADEEADSIADVIEELTMTKKKSYAYNDIAILVRANSHAQVITGALKQHKIPYQFLGPEQLFQQGEIKDLIAYLFFLSNLSDSISLFRVLSMDIFHVPYIELSYLLNFAKTKNMNLFDALFSQDTEFVTPETRKKLDSFLHMVKKHTASINKDSAGQILYDFLVDSHLYDTLQQTNSVIEERRVQNIAKFFEKIKKFETDRKDANLFTLVEWLNLMMQMGDSPLAAEVDTKETNAVNILTVHSSKGLEFGVVFLVNLVSDRFPSRERSEKIPLPIELMKEKITKAIDFHLEEERRLFYVGMTRAKEVLYLTAADYYGTGKRAKKISPFVYETLPELQQHTLPLMHAQQLSLSEALSPYKKNEKLQSDLSPSLPYKVTSITYSNLQMFDICPLHYKAKVIFNLPSPTESVQSFGISIHNTLYNFYRHATEGNVLSQELLFQLLKREWISDGYSSKKHEEERFQQATDMLSVFYKTESQQFSQPIGLELPFSFTLKNGVKVFGKIDRIDKKGNGIEIIDYKTGQNNPKAKSAHELQLAMYALAATRVKDSLLNRTPENITLTLHFLDGNTKEHMTFTKEELDKLEEKLMEKITDIEKSDFACSKNILCLTCEYKMLCKTSS